MNYKFGGVFPQEIIKGKKSRNYNIEGGEDKEKISYQRLYFFAIILVLGLGILLIKLFTLTIIEGERYRKLATENRLRENKIIAPRGIIYDRNGIPLVRNIPVFKTRDGQIYFESRPSTSPSLVQESVARDYIYKAITAHVLGYVGEAEGEELGKQITENRKQRIELGDFIGKGGIEKTYDGILRGINGKELIEVDALEKRVRVLGDIKAVPGRNINTSLDLKLQSIAYGELENKVGAVVATNPNTGEVYILYSSPSFDQNKLIRDEGIAELFNDPNKPFFNRAISGLYPPGSTFKIVTALAALESGSIHKDTQFEDVGILQVGQFTFGNWYFSQYGKKEGLVDIITAIKRSNDIFFYKTGEATGIETLAKWGKKVGIGNVLGIDILGEAEGVMPDPEWRKKERGDNWYLGDTYHVAIGQGDLQTTPLQVNAWTNVIASDGRLCRPHLVKTEGGQDTSDGVRKHSSGVEGAKKACRDLGIKKETVSLIREGMKQACSPGGTGWPMFKFKIKNEKLKIDGINFLPTYEATASGQPLVEVPVACKTGTAEFGDPNNRTHAWFTVFAPVENPQISVTVLVEGGGEGSNVAAPIAKKILEEWFSR